MTTKPVSAAVAPTIAASSEVAVDAEYSSAVGTVISRVSDRLEQPEHRSCDAAQQRQEPEAPLQVLACLEVERPHGTACHTAPEQFARIIPLG